RSCRAVGKGARRVRAVRDEVPAVALHDVRDPAQLDARTQARGRAPRRPGHRGRRGGNADERRGEPGRAEAGDHAHASRAQAGDRDDARTAAGGARTAHRRGAGAQDARHERARVAPVSALLSPPAQPYRADVHAIGDAVRARIEGKSWQPSDPRCPALSELAYVTLDHVTFDGGTARGELVVAAALAPRVVELFRRLYQLGFPIRQMRLVDDYEASDDRSMSADNSSAFNFRVIAGTDIL